MRDKKLIKYFVVIGILFIGLVIVELNKKKPVDWTPTFINIDKNPYGTYILYDLLKDIFPGRNINTSRFPIYNELNYISEEDDLYGQYKDDEYADEKETSIDKPQVTDGNLQSYLFINQRFGVDASIPMLQGKRTENAGVDKLDIKNLLAFVAEGNNTFIAAEKMSLLLLDKLKLSIKSEWNTSDTTYIFNDLKGKEYSYTSISGGLYYFHQKDSSDIPMQILAETKVNKKPVFVKIKYGQGNIYLNTLPVAFTNIELLNLDKYDFAFTCLSYLPKENDIIWDEYQKQGRIGEYSTFRVVWNHLAMLWAYYLILVTGLLFILFRSKRMQRIIPVIEPPKNTSLEFLDTISNLYYQREAYESIVEKRHNYFLDMVRTRYHINTETVDEEFIETLSMKSGVGQDTIDQIFRLYELIGREYDISNRLLLSYNEKLEEFYKNMK